MEFDKSNLKTLKDFYNQCQLEEILKRIKEFPEINDFNVYQEVQLYKGLSLYELSEFQEGCKIMNQLFQLKIEKKGNKVEDIDLAVQILFLWQVFFESFNKSEKQNDNFKEILEAYQLQNQSRETYNHGLYLFGLGTWNFIKNYRDDDNFESIEILIKSLNLLPEYENQIILGIAWIFVVRMKYQDSIDWCKRLYQKCPLFPGISNNLAIAYENLEMYKEAEEYYLIAENLGKTNIVILNNIAQYYQNNNQNDKAQEYFQKSYQINPNHPQTCCCYGVFLYKNNQQEEGLKMLEKGLQFDPTYSEIYLELASIEFDKGRAEKSIEIIDKCIELYPDQGQFYMIKGDYFAFLNTYDKAIVNYEEALQRKLHTGQRIELTSKIGFSYYQLDNYFKSLQYYIKSLNTKTQQNNFLREIESISFLLELPEYSDQKKIEIISQEQGIFHSRLYSLIQTLENERIVIFLKQILDEYTQTAVIIAYQKVIQPTLTYQNELSHWDMYFD